jgi:hypothetical protein
MVLKKQNAITALKQFRDVQSEVWKNDAYVHATNTILRLLKNGAI